MDYEKRYNETLERARKEWVENLDNCYTNYRERLEIIFPELKESEDERIRNFLIDFIKICIWTEKKDQGWPSREDCLAWLEKQGEQTQLDYEHADIPKKDFAPIEPKFKVGDWVILPLGIIAHIDSLNSTDYQVTTTDGKICDFKISKQDNYHLWTIADAKDGDLIYVSTEIKGIQAIFHKFENGIIYFHCYLCSDFKQGGYEPSGDVKFVNPLQKVHYQKFFQRMKQAGYEWDAEKKELKKTEQKKLDADEVIEWLHYHIQVDEPKIEYNEDGQPLAESFLVHAEARCMAADEVVKQFKKDFGL